MNAIPREAWFTVDPRSLDGEMQDGLESLVVAAARGAAEREGVGFRMERKIYVDYSKSGWKRERLESPLVQTALATASRFHKPGTPFRGSSAWSRSPSR